MSDEPKKENVQPFGAETQKQSPELSNEELNKAVGGAVNLQIDGIKGESQDDKHKDWIELSSF